MSKPISRNVMKFFTPSERGWFDFKNLDSFADDYLSAYYAASPTMDEVIILNFLVREFRKIRSNPDLIEIGCGPTVHHILPVCNYVKSITMSDYLNENLDRIRRWKGSHASAHKWDKFTALVLTHEGVRVSEKSIEKREIQAKNKIRKFLHCDLKKTKPLGKLNCQYPVVTCFYCTEEIGVDLPQWTQVMANLCSIVSPGGLLFLSALKETSFYSAGGLHGKHKKLPCAFLHEKDFINLLPNLGFDLKRSLITSEKVYGLENEGVHDVILIKAKKYK